MMSKDATQTVAEGTAMPGGCAPPAEVAALREQLASKEQLVAALTERLEQAAEQLDRLRRTGADKGRRPLGGGIPAELVEQQRAAFDDLKRVIDRWEDMQAEATLGRIEAQISELRDLIAGNAAGGLARPENAARPSSNTWWERQKAAMLGEAPPPEPVSSSGAPSAAVEDANADIDSIHLPPLPDPIDFDALTLEDARAALRERDRIIRQLREPLLVLRAARALPANWSSIDTLPEQARARLDELESGWQARFRQAELELSLERARLARESAQVRMQAEMLQSQMKRAAGPARAATTEPGADDDAPRRRWFRFMNRAPGRDEQGPPGSEQS